MQDNNENKTSDTIMSLVKKIKAIPSPIKAAAGGCLSQVAMFLPIIVLVIAVFSIGGSVTEFFSKTGESVSNFFNGYGWQTSDEAQKEQEEKYYLKLEQVYNKYHTEEYDNIEINTTLITATLFFNRLGGDLAEYNCDETNANGDCIGSSGSTQSPLALADFYKEARGHIDVLARMMIVRNVEEYKCGDVASIKSAPGSVKELANQKWESLELSKLASFAKRTITITQVLATEENSYPKCQYSPISTTEQDEIIAKASATTLGKSILNRSKNLAKSYASNKCSTTDSAICKGIATSYEGLRKELTEFKYYGPFLDFDISNNGEYKFNCPSDFYGSKSDENSLGKGNENNYCQQYLSEKDTYTSEWYREGYYYYKLQTPYSTINPFDQYSGKSFIELYYGDYVDKSNVEQSVLDIVDGIYSYYNVFKDDMKIYHEEYESGELPEVSTIVASGPWATWSQKDPAWGNLMIGNNTIYNIGCATTSVAMLIASSGVPTTVSGDFNPGSFMLAHKAAGGYAGVSGCGGNCISWDVSRVAPSFQFVGQTRANLTVEYIGNLLKQGYYVALQVLPDSNMHWVAVAGVENGTVWIYDPAFMESARHPKPENLHTGGWGTPYGMYRIVYYKVV